MPPVLLFLPSLALAAPLKTTVVGTPTWRSPGSIDSVAVHGDTLWLAAGGRIMGLDPAGNVVADFKACDSEHGGLYPFGTIELSPDGDKLAIACGDVRLVSLPSGRHLWSTERQTGAPSMAFSPDGALLHMVTDTVREDNTVDYWHLRSFRVATGERLRDVVDRYLFIDRAPVGYVAGTLDEQHFVSLDEDLEERWRIPRSRGEHRYSDLPGRLCFADDRRVRCVDSATGADRETLELPPTGEDWRYQLDPGTPVDLGDELWLSWSQELHRWSPHAGLQALPSQPPGRGWVRWGDRVVSWEGPPRVIVLTADGARVDPEEEWGEARIVALDQDGDTIALVDEEGRLFAGAVDRPLRLLPGRFDTTDLLRMSPDGSWLLAEGTGDEGPVIVEVATGARRPLLLEGHAVEYASGAFGADGTLYVTASVRPPPEHEDFRVLGTVDRATGRVDARVPVTSTYDLLWVHDGKALATWNDAGWLMDLTTGERGPTTREVSSCGRVLLDGVLHSCTETDDGERLGTGPVFEGGMTLGPPGAPYVVSDLFESRVRMFRPTDHRLLGTLSLDVVEDPHFSGDGKAVALRQRDGRVVVVRVP